MLSTIATQSGKWQFGTLWVVRMVVLVALLIGIAACAPATLRMYNGPALPASETVILEKYNDVVIVSINGKTPLKANLQKIEMLPGNYTIVAHYFSPPKRLSDEAVQFMRTTDWKWFPPEVVSGEAPLYFFKSPDFCWTIGFKTAKPLTLIFECIKGHRYLLRPYVSGTLDLYYYRRHLFLLRPYSFGTKEERFEVEIVAYDFAKDLSSGEIPKIVAEAKAEVTSILLVGPTYQRQLFLGLSELQ